MNMIADVAVGGIFYIGGILLAAAVVAVITAIAIFIINRIRKKRLKDQDTER